MKGQVIAFDEQTNKGKISGHDGKRYSFTRVQWANSEQQPKVGLEVDFDVDDDDSAKDIIILKGGAASEKSRTAFIILAILVGPLGIHNFYAGYTGKGTVQLLISVLSLGILAPVVWIWNLVEAVTVKQDVEGNSFA
ncbi:MAG: TM2 domain-containing protein [Xanthomonadales bacterium]|nr:TM2 domain-containing protein [Xanthomonadales bacterium]